VSNATDPIAVTTTLREFEGKYIEEGYDFISVGEENGWRAVASWGLDGWDLAEWPYNVYLFREVYPILFREVYPPIFAVYPSAQRANYCEGDITIETYSTVEAREEATNETAMYYWLSKNEAWVAGVERAEGRTTAAAEVPERFKGPFSWKRLNESKFDV